MAAAHRLGRAREDRHHDGLNALPSAAAVALGEETFPTLQSPLLRQWRLASGQALWCYIALHFINHALGLVSLDAAEAGLKLAAFVWQSLPGTVLLYGAAATHVMLALASLHQRHTLRLPPAELLRIGFGLTIPLLLLGHVVGTRVAYEWFGEAPHYRRIVTNLIRSGNTGWQLALLAPGWAHGCMGLNVAFRHHAWFLRWRPALLAAAVGLPLLAAGGFWVMTRELADVANAANAPRALLDVIHQQRLGLLRERLLDGYLLLVAAVLVSRAWFVWRRGRGATAQRPRP